MAKTTKKAAQARSPEQLLAGGESLEVEYLDGTTEVIHVRQATLRNVGQLALFINTGNILGRIEWYADRKTPWAETLTRESRMKIFEKGNELAVPTFEEAGDFDQVETQTLARFLQPAKKS